MLRNTSDSIQKRMIQIAANLFSSRGAIVRLNARTTEAFLLLQFVCPNCTVTPLTDTIRVLGVTIRCSLYCIKYCYVDFLLKIYLCPPYVIGGIIFLPCGFFLFFYSSPNLSRRDWMSTILRHMVWPLCEFRMQV